MFHTLFSAFEQQLYAQSDLAAYKSCYIALWFLVEIIIFH